MSSAWRGCSTKGMPNRFEERSHQPAFSIAEVPSQDPGNGLVLHARNSLGNGGSPLVRVPPLGAMAPPSAVGQPPRGVRSTRLGMEIPSVTSTWEEVRAGSRLLPVSCSVRNMGGSACGL